MTKRAADPEESESPYLKRQRFATSQSTKQKSVESEDEHQIRSVQDLKILLAFAQDVDPQSLRQSKSPNHTVLNPTHIKYRYQDLKEILRLNYLRR